MWLWHVKSDNYDQRAEFQILFHLKPFEFKKLSVASGSLMDNSAWDSHMYMINHQWRTLFKYGDASHGYIPILLVKTKQLLKGLEKKKSNYWANHISSVNWDDPGDRGVASWSTPKYKKAGPKGLVLSSELDCHPRWAEQDLCMKWKTYVSGQTKKCRLGRK